MTAGLSGGDILIRFCAENGTEQDTRNLTRRGLRQLSDNVPEGTLLKLWFLKASHAHQLSPTDLVCIKLLVF